MQGTAVTLYEKFSEGSEGYIISFDLSELFAKTITGVQINDGLFSSEVITEEATITTIQNYIDDVDCPDVAYAKSSDIMYLFLKTLVYPHASNIKFIVYGTRYAKPITSLSENLDIRETEVELFINYALREGALYQGKKAEPIIEQNIRLLESQLQG